MSSDSSLTTRTYLNLTCGTIRLDCAFDRCCTVNHPQGWPKFISNAFVTTPDMSSLVQVYLGPFSTQTTLANGALAHCSASGLPSDILLPTGNKVTANVETLYPFSDTVTTTLTANRAFTYQVRIPSWVSHGTIAVNGGVPKPVAPENGLHSVRVGAGTTKLVLNLPADITLGEFSSSRRLKRTSDGRVGRVAPARLHRRASRAAALRLRHPAEHEGPHSEFSAASGS